MPINKNAYIRYRTLDQCFRNRQKNYFIDDLRDACEEALVSSNFVGGVSRRQIYDDIRFMESDDGFSIELDRKHDGKKYIIDMPTPASVSISSLFLEMKLSNYKKLLSLSHVFVVYHSTTGLRMSSPI